MSIQTPFHGVALPSLAPSPAPASSSLHPSVVFWSAQKSSMHACRSGTYFCVDKGVTSVVIKGLADHREMLGAPLFPCRHYDDKATEVAQGFWNCPCVPMRERKECHCMLFLTPDNDFARIEQTISIEEIKETI